MLTKDDIVVFLDTGAIHALCMYRNPHVTNELLSHILLCETGL